MHTLFVSKSHPRKLLRSVRQEQDLPQHDLSDSPWPTDADVETAIRMASLAMMGNFEEAKFTDEELNEPELHKQLNQLLSEKSERLPLPNHMEIHGECEQDQHEVLDIKKVDKVPVDLPSSKTSFVNEQLKEVSLFELGDTNPKNGSGNNIVDIGVGDSEVSLQSETTFPDIHLQMSANLPASESATVSSDENKVTINPSTSEAQPLLNIEKSSRATGNDQNEYTTNTPISIENHKKTFAAIESILGKQIENYGARALECKNVGNQQGALDWLRKRREVISDLDLVNLARSSLAPPPAFHVDTRYSTVELVRHDISANEMRIEIFNLRHNKNQRGRPVQPPDIYFVCEIGYPDVNAPTKIMTPVVKGSSLPNLNYVNTIHIERNRAFERFLKRKLVFKMYRPSRWFFGWPTMLGKTEMKIQDLTHCSELQCDLTLYRDDLHEAQCKIAVRVQLRTPICKKEMLTSSEKILIIDKHLVGALTCEITSEDGGVAEGVQGDNKDREVVATSKDKQGGDKMVNEEVEYESLDWIVSNDVLEWMQTNINRKLAQVKAEGGDGMEDEVDMLKDKLQQIEMKMQLMIIQVQQNILTVERYREVLEEKIREERQLAIRLKCAGKEEAAKEALIRVKLMKKEMVDGD